MTDQETCNVGDLLSLFLELKGLSPELEKWTEQALQDNPPRLYRLQQLKALFRAFGIPLDFDAFLKGTFIPAGDPRYSPLLADLAADLPDDSTNCLADQLPCYFEMLLEYRMRVEHVLTFTSGVYAASGLYRKAYHEADELSGTIRDNVASIDTTLARIVDPDGATFTRAELIAEYQFPDVDTEQSDLDWM